jgi:hypothetical protein
MPYFAVPVNGHYNRVPGLATTRGAMRKSAMGETSPEGSRPTPALRTPRFLGGYAAHFDRNVTTVQRWEKREGMFTVICMTGRAYLMENLCLWQL